MPVTSQIAGDSVGQSATLMSIVGASSTFTRILIGWISDQPWSDAIHIRLYVNHYFDKLLYMNV